MGTPGRHADGAAGGTGTYRITDQMQVATIYRGRSGAAFDVRAGAAFDLNGDGQFNDRVPGFTRNSYRGEPNHTVDARFTWQIPFGAPRRLQVTVESFNLLNRENVENDQHHTTVRIRRRPTRCSQRQSRISRRVRFSSVCGSCSSTGLRPYRAVRLEAANATGGVDVRSRLCCA